MVFYMLHFLKKTGMNQFKLKRTLVSVRDGCFDHTVVWIEGVEVELSFNKQTNSFGMVGGVINTNSGVGFTKEMLLEIASKMDDTSILKVCGCNRPVSEELILKYWNIKS